MPKESASRHRERKQHKAKHGMRVSNRSLKSVILPTIAKKAEEATRRLEKGTSR